MNKKQLQILSLVLVVALVLLVCAFCGIQQKQDQVTPTTQGVQSIPSTQQTTTAPETTIPPTTAVPTQPPTEAPTEPPQPMYYNPFTGEGQYEPFTARPFLISINNNKNAMPFCGMNDADIVFEMLVNARSTRCLALVTDVYAIERIGAIRSLRYNFIDIAQAYDGIVVYAGASDQVLADMRASGVANLNALKGNNGGAFYREQGRLDAGYAREHTLFTIPTLMAQYAEKSGYATTLQAEKDYGFHFVEDATPIDGYTARTITMNFFTGNKQTIMKYNSATGRYQMHQYGADQTDGNSGEPITFKNVFTLFAVNEDIGQYHVAQLLGSGNGYYATGGKIIPILWHHETENEPFAFTYLDGTPLEQSVGNSYVGIVPTGSAFSYS